LLPQTDTFRLAFRLNRLFFPADLYDFARAISAKGYQILSPIGPKQPYPVVQLGGTANPFAQKPDALLDINTEKGVVGITGPNIPLCLDAMQEIVKLFEDQFYTTTQDYMFFEFNGLMHIASQTNPIITISKLSQGIKYVEKCSKILSKDLSIRSIHLVPKNKPMDDLDYFDITIEPLISAQTRILIASILYRQASLDLLSKEIRSIETKIESIVSSLRDN
jgi:hypothetical protein